MASRIRAPLLPQFARREARDEGFISPGSLPMFMNVACPTCGHICRFPERMIGRQVECSACSNPFQCGTMSPPSLTTRPLSVETSSSVQAMPSARAVQVQPNQGIHYRCPRCTKPLESPVHMAGHKVHCPDCGQRLQIPATSTIAPALVSQPIPAIKEPSAAIPPHQTTPSVRPTTSAPADKEVILTVLPATSPPASTRREHCLECGVDVTQRSHIQTCPDCGSLFCSARCYREHNYHAHPSRRR
jgi:DNA-directed RNA polymerase subunit RPC12/RpoP